MQIPAVEDRILGGLQSKFLSQFGCDLVVAQTTDQIKQLQLRANGHDVKYPYAYAKLTSISSPENSDVYVSRYLLRKGINFTEPNANAGYNIRLLPTQFDFEVTYETNNASGDGGIMWYIKRWLMASRQGLLKFRIEFGNVRLNIDVRMDLNVSVPNERPAPSEAETAYKVITNLQVRGYMSEMQAKPVASPNLQEVRMQVGLQDGENLFNEDMKPNG